MFVECLEQLLALQNSRHTVYTHLVVNRAEYSLSQALCTVCFRYHGLELKQIREENIVIERGRVIVGREEWRTQCLSESCRWHVR